MHNLMIECDSEENAQRLNDELANSGLISLAIVQAGHLVKVVLTDEQQKDDWDGEWEVLLEGILEEDSFFDYKWEHD